MDSMQNYQSLVNAARSDHNITTLNVSYQRMGVEDAAYLATSLKDTQVTTLYLGENNIGDLGVKYLAESLKDTQVTTLGLGRDNDAVVKATLQYNTLKINNICKQFKSIISDTVIGEQNGIEAGILLSKSSGLTTKPNNICTYFKSIIFGMGIGEQNNIEAGIFLSQYLDLIKVIKDMPGIIPHLMKDNPKCTRDNILNIIQEMPVDFTIQVAMTYTRLEDQKIFCKDVPACLELLQQSEAYNLPEVSQHLLLHRPLFYVDNAGEILHPDAYTALKNHGMTIFNKDIEPHKLETITQYYKSVPELKNHAPMLLKLLGEECE